MTIIKRLSSTLVLLALLGIFGAVQAQTTIEVMIRPNPGDEFVYEELKQAFEKAHPDIKVEYISSPFGEYFQKFTVMYAGGTAPDIIFPNTSNTISYAMQGMLMPLDDFIKRDSSIEDIFPEVLNMYRVDGKLYGIPNDIAAQAFVYNTDLWAQYGISRPALDWTTDEFVAIGRKLTVDTNGDGKIDCFAVGGTNNNFFIWSALGSNFFDDELYPRKFLLNSPAGYQGLQFIQDMRWKEHIVPQPGESADIYAGTATATTVGQWNLAVIVKQATFNWDLISVPRIKESVQRADGSSWSIVSTTKHPEAAWTFVKFMIYEGSLVQARNQFITPANRKVATSPEWRRIPNGPVISKDPFVHGLNNSFNNYILSHPKASQVMDLINPAINRVWNNEATPREAIEAVADAVEALLPEFN